MKTTEIREIIETINKENSNEFLHLVNLGGKKFGLYKGDWAKNTGYWQTKGNLDFVRGFIAGKYDK